MKIVHLLPPQFEEAPSFFYALKNRKSSREFNSKEIPAQILSNLLWAANGMNRPESNHKTAPSAMNSQEIDIYVAKADGLYLFDAKKHELLLIIHEDIRVATGTQPFVKNAPLNLIYVADFSKTNKLGDDADLITGMDAGFISENVYLYCAFAGLATVVRNWIDRDLLTKTVNYPCLKAKACS